MFGWQDIQSAILLFIYGCLIFASVQIVRIFVHIWRNR